MTFMSRPRLTLFGQFQADVSTVNNDVRHFSNADWEDRFQSPSGPDGTENGWWNPNGTGAFRLSDLKVRSASSPGDQVGADPVIGMAMQSQRDRSSAKIVDLDPQFQMASAIFGLELALLDGQTEVMRCRFRTAPFRDIYFGRSSTQGSGGASAKFTSVLTDVVWSGDVSRSPSLTALRDTSRANRDQLSASLMTFGYGSGGFTLGGVALAIGPWRIGDPLACVAQRRFAPAAGRNPFATPQGIGFFDAEADETLRLDLSNALPLADNSGALRDLGPIHVGILRRPDAETNAGSQTWTITPSIKEGDVLAAADLLDLGELPYRQANWLVQTGGIAEILLASAARALATDHPLALVQPAPGGAGWTVLIRETIGGLFVRADDFVHRVDAQKGQAVARRVDLLVRRYGVPTPAVPVTLAQRGQEDGEGIGGNAPNPPKAPVPSIGVPTTALTAPATVVSDAVGTAQADLEVSDPGNPRGYVDGQIYKLDYQFAIADVSPVPMLDQIVFHVRDGFDPPKAPDWGRDVKPILVQYGNLYPIMSRGLFSFSDPNVVAAHAHLLKFAFERPEDDSNHMPVTRDLSAGKRQMIVAWLDQQFDLQSSAPAIASAAAVANASAAPPQQPTTAAAVRRTPLPRETLDFVRSVVGEGLDGKSRALLSTVQSMAQTN